MPLVVNETGDIKNSEDTELQQYEMNELISRRPGFLSNWALALFIIILGILFSCTWLVHYPDVVTSRATIIANNVPKEIIARQEGRLIKLFVHNGENVIAGRILGFMESNGSHQQVILLDLKLDSILRDLQSGNTRLIPTYFGKGLDTLGELQQNYQEFISSLQKFGDYIENGYYDKKRKVLLSDILLIEKNRNIIKQQKELMERDLKLSEETYASQERLLKENVISKQDNRNELSKLLGKQLTIPQINSSLLSSETQQREKEKEITDLEHTISQQKTLFITQVQTLQSQVKDWMKRYIISSPISGQVNFLIPIQESNYFTMNKLLGYVNPIETGYYAEAYLPQSNFGKLKIGQRVQLRFDAYPYSEFGYVNGTLDYITDFATDSGFLGHIKLPEGLLTNQRKELHYRNGLKAEARVVTKDARLIERFYRNLIEASSR